MTNLNKSAIYAITHDATGRQYIGSAVRVGQRWNEHKSHLNRRIHHAIKLQNAWNKYGANAFTFSILEVVDNKNDLIKKEQRWFGAVIPFFNSTLTAGSCLGFKHSEETKRKVSEALRRRAPASAETRAKISAAKKGVPLKAEHREMLAELQRNRSPEWRKKLSIARLGKKASAETRERLSKAHTGRAHSEETKAKIAAAHKGRPKSADHRSALAAAARSREHAKRVRQYRNQQELF